MTKDNTTAQICNIAEEKGIFDSIEYIGKIDDRDGYVEIERDNVRVLIRREEVPSKIGYSGTANSPTHITYFYAANSTLEMYFRTFDPKEISITKQNPYNQEFENNESTCQSPPYERQPELEILVKDILDFFN